MGSHGYLTVSISICLSVCLAVCLSVLLYVYRLIYLLIYSPVCCIYLPPYLCNSAYMAETWHMLAILVICKGWHLSAPVWWGRASEVNKNVLGVTKVGGDRAGTTSNFRLVVIVVGIKWLAWDIQSHPWSIQTLGRFLESITRLRGAGQVATRGAHRRAISRESPHSDWSDISGRGWTRWKEEFLLVDSQHPKPQTNTMLLTWMDPTSRNKEKNIEEQHFPYEFPRPGPDFYKHSNHKTSPKFSQKSAHIPSRPPRRVETWWPCPRSELLTSAPADRKPAMGNPHPKWKFMGKIHYICRLQWENPPKNGSLRWENPWKSTINMGFSSRVWLLEGKANGQPSNWGHPKSWALAMPFFHGNSYPYAPCMVYLPTFGWFLGKMLVNIPYMEHMGCVYVYMIVWLVVDLSLWTIWVRQLGWWNSQYMEK